MRKGKFNIRKITAIFSMAVIFISCTVTVSAAEPTNYAETTELENTVRIESGVLTQTVRQRTLNKNETYTFDLVHTDEKTGDKYFLWDTEHTVVSTTTSRTESVRHSADYTDLYDKDEVPKTIEWVNPVNGKKHTLPLISKSFSNTTIKNRTGSVTAMIEYGWQTYIPKPKNEITVSYFDAPSGKTVRGVVQYKNLVQDYSFRWRNDVEVVALFEVYEAEYYKLENTEIYIPYSTTTPAIGGKEVDIVNALGEDNTRFYIDRAVWTDEVHTRNGIEIRNAVFTGSRYVGKYIANYESSWKLPDCDGYNCTAEYGMSVDILSGTKEYTVESVATYRRITTTAAVLIGVGVFLLLAGIVITLIILVKRRRKNHEAQKDSNTETSARKQMFKWKK